MVIIMKREIKAWAVVWKKASMFPTLQGYIVGADTDVENIAWINYPLFSSRKKAMEFRNENFDWKVIRCVIKI